MNELNQVPTFSHDPLHGQHLKHPFCKARILPILSEVSGAVVEHSDIHEIMDLVVRAIKQYLPGADRILLSILNRESGTIFVESGYGVTQEERDRGVYRPGEGVTGRVIQSGRPWLVPRISEEPSFLDRTGARKDVDTSKLAFLCVPVRLGHEVLGSLSLDRPTASEESLNEDLQVMQIVAAMIAQAVELHQARREETIKLVAENRRLQDELAHRYHPSKIIGNSRTMQELFLLMEKVYDRTTPVLVLGESGTGKELVAQALHYQSPRKNGPFIRFNCAAIPESIAESELFGHEKGSFTGAIAMRTGRFEDADGGTLFLDEIGELSVNLQAKLLRVLQQREFERVGGNKTLKVDVRFIAATNRDLGAMIKAGTFREDLFYRLNVFPLTLPPLRERGSDVLLLADFFVERYGEAHQLPVRRISSPAIDALMAYHWPGNVRELENVIERAVILSEDGVIHAYHLPPSLQTAESSGTRYAGSLEQKLEQVERETIIESIKNARGNMAQASRDLGITERIMALRMKKYHIDFRLYRGSQP